MLGKRNLDVLGWLCEEHVLDINTNLAFPLAALRSFRRPEHVFLSASFHPAAGVAVQDFIAKVSAVEAEGFTVTGASLVGWPPYLRHLSAWRRQFDDAGITFVARPCDGPYEGRRLPQEYTPAEREILAQHLTGEALRFQLQSCSAKGTLCATGWRYLLVEADGTVCRCPQGQGDIGGLNFYRDWVPLRDHPTVCGFDGCWCEDLWSYHLSEPEKLAWLGAAE
jgi:hypothetical protein